MSKNRFIHTGLNRAKSKAHRLQLPLREVKWVIFSDLHRGHRDGADDFLICERTYMEALSFYYEQGYTLVLLGDVEELWENSPVKVLHQYRDVLLKEQLFFEKGRMLRVWGNHDDDWQYRLPLNKHLGRWFPGIRVHEAIELSMTEGGESVGKLFLVHGHQGTLASERWAWASKIFVRYVWRNFQRVFKVPLSTPSKDIRLRSLHDFAMYDWASGQGRQVLICGHTHQPVFMSMTHRDRLRAKISALLQKETVDVERIRALEKKLDRIEQESTPLETDNAPKKPCYFNSGCCSFSDGDITGLEVSEGSISLVKWNERGKSTLESEKITLVFNGLDESIQG